ncbi:PTS transporter subunit EIIB [Enterococcus faecalis]|nr:PTS transporter subunit EIIB [Enterococcus faecalis]
MAENYQQAAKDIIQLIGMDNIISVTHCQTVKYSFQLFQ